jgi:mRNA-degrading endonuclease RelE of RelBE toxin-antitoxin system
LRAVCWTVRLKESAIGDLAWFGKKDGRMLLKEAEQYLSADPLLESRSMRTLRPNPIAQRELRLFGKYRVLFNVDEENKQVTIILVGDKRGNSLFVQGQEYASHESDTTE